VDAPVHRDSATGVIPGLLTRVRVLAADSGGDFRVHCGACADSTAGRVAAAELIFTPPPLAEAVHGTAAEFALALRDAIARHDVSALRSVMAPDFSSGFVGPSNPDIAIVAWRGEGYRSLDEAVALLDGGLVLMGRDVWVAPAAFRDRPGYAGLRLGIGRGAGGRWVWLFLLRGER
jgi:hypothetical protein